MSEALLDHGLQAPVEPAHDLGSLKQPGAPQSARVVPMAQGPLEQMADVPVTLAFEVARLEITIRQLLAMKEDSVLELPVSSLDNIRVLVDGKTIALGDVTAQQQRYGIRIEAFCSLDNDEGADTP